MTAWTDFVKEYRVKHGISYKDALIACSTLYKERGGSKSKSPKKPVKKKVKKSVKEDVKNEPSLLPLKRSRAVKKNSVSPGVVSS